MDATIFFKQFQDYLSPKMNTYEQAVYLYIVRHSRLEGVEDVVIGFKSARKTMAFGIGKAGTPMSENQCYITLRSLEQKGFINILGSERNGTRVHPFLPSEISNLFSPEAESKIFDLEEVDFFEDSTYRQLILEREELHCFYCLRKINSENFVIEHVVSRPKGNNSYRNVVAACRSCNNRKDSSSAEEYFRLLFRESFLDEEEFLNRMHQLQLLQAGELKPKLLR
ncbi:MAG: HNH endonuclease signature motif containing protein [Syntrophaceae bacterium]